MASAQAKKDPKGAYYLPSRESDPVFVRAITSFLCTVTAFEIFQQGAEELWKMNASDDAGSGEDVWTNRRCLEEARRFFEFADVEGFRGSPHKL
jgi:hypothetical protein